MPALLREFRAIAFVKELIAAGRLPHGEYRDIRMHRIDADEAFKDLSASSKVNAEWAFLEYLRDLGRTAASDWLDEHFDAVGDRPTLDLSDYFRSTSAGRASSPASAAGCAQFLATGPSRRLRAATIDGARLKHCCQASKLLAATTSYHAVKS